LRFFSIEGPYWGNGRTGFEVVGVRIGMPRGGAGLEQKPENPSPQGAFGFGHGEAMVVLSFFGIEGTGVGWGKCNLGEWGVVIGLGKQRGELGFASPCYLLLPPLFGLIIFSHPFWPHPNPPLLTPPTLLHNPLSSHGWPCIFCVGVCGLGTSTRTTALTRLIAFRT